MPSFGLRDATNVATAPWRRSAFRKRLLIVEDESLVALLLAGQIAELDYAVVGPAFTMSQARHLADTATIDGALLDLHLNGVLAHEVADILSRRQIPFVFITGYTKPPVGPYPDIPVLQKPFKLIDLMGAIERMVNPSVHYVTSEQRR